MSRFVVPLLLLLSLPLSAQTTDLELTVNNFPVGRMGINKPITATFSIQNRGSEAVGFDQTTLVFDVPDGISDVRIRVTDRSVCSDARPTMRCRIGVGGPRSTEYVSIEGIASRAGEIVFAGRLETTVNDPNLTNNTTSSSVLVIDGSEMKIAIDSIFPRLEPGALKSVGIHLEHDSTVRTPRDVQVKIDATGGTIETIEAPGWTCSTAGATATCTTPEFDNDFRSITVGVRAPADRSGGRLRLQAGVTTSTTDILPGNNLDVESVDIYRWIAVTTTNDGGAGSLRAAIVEANERCTAGPCRIVFELAGSAPHTIEPRTPLPPVTGWIRFNQDSHDGPPEIVLDGRHLAAGDGIEFRASCEGNLSGFAIGNFPGAAVRFRDRATGCAGAEGHSVIDSHLGTDASGELARPNFRGVEVDGATVHIGRNVISANRRSGVFVLSGQAGVVGNRIGVSRSGAALGNGASGVYFGPGTISGSVRNNVISHHLEMGVAIAARARLVDVGGNTMRHNAGLPIDRDLNGEGNGNDVEKATAPVLTSARYDAATNTTVITGVLRTPVGAPLFNNVLIDVYTNDGPSGQGERHHNTSSPGGGTEIPFTAGLAGDWRGRWVTATATRAYYLFSRRQAPNYTNGADSTWTSEMSNAVEVQ